MKFRLKITGVIGNFLEHYDNALFGLLSPFIAPLFFEQSDPLTSLILMYCILPIGFITRPLGSLFFGWIGDTFGRRKALILSLIGMALATTAMGFLPTYRAIGIYAPICLAFCRMLQGFFSAGETTGGAIFVLENTSFQKRTLISSFFDASSMGGVFLASFLVYWMSSEGWIGQYWRILFWGGSFSALIGIILRFMPIDTAEFVKTTKNPRFNLMKILKENRFSFFAIIFASGFSYTIYSMAFTLLNGYVPLITSISKPEMMQLNTILLIFDFILLLVFGWLALRYGKERVMKFGVLCSILFCIPLFCLLNQASLGVIISVRILIIIFGVAFAAPYYAWAIEQIPVQHRFLILSLGGAIGSQVLGTPSTAIGLWLFKMLHWSGAPAIYLSLIGVATGLVLYRSTKVALIRNANVSSE